MFIIRLLTTISLCVVFSNAFGQSSPDTLRPSANPPSICFGQSSQLNAGVSNTSFTVDSIPFSYIPVPVDASIPTVGAGDDHVGGPYPIPFVFNFFGSSYSQLYISTNGNIQFGPSTNQSFTPGPLPNQQVLNFVALCWADLTVNPYSSNGTIRYFTAGQAPSRIFVINYDSCGLYGVSNGKVSGQIWLKEIDRTIEVHLRKSVGFATTGGGLKTIGVNNFNGTIGTAAPNRNGTAWQTTTPEAWRFTPPQRYKYKWTPSIGLNNAQIGNPIATPTATTRYRLIATDTISGQIDSGSVLVTVNPIVTPVITVGLIKGNNPSCAGDTLKLKATFSGGGSNPSFQWFRNGGTLFGQTDSILTLWSFNTGDKFTCRLTSDAECRNNDDTLSNEMLLIRNQLPTVAISPSGTISICQGKTITLTANGAVSYAWLGGPNVATKTVAQAGQYFVTGTDANGCKNTASVNVIVNPVPDAQITPTGPLTICPGASSILTLNVQTGNSIRWLKDQIAVGSVGQTYSANSTGAFQAEVTNAFGCKDTSNIVSVSIQTITTPNVTAGGPTVFCQGGSVQLSSDVSNGNKWSNGAQTQSILVSQSGTYRDTVIVNGCKAVSNAITVTVNPLPSAAITPNGPTTFCSGGSVLLMASGGTGYSWNTGQNIASISVSQAGNFIVTVTNSFGCQANANVTTQVNPNPTIGISASGPPNFCTGDTVLLTATGAATYVWTPGNRSGTALKISQNGTYTVVGTSALGCSGSAQTVYPKALQIVSFSPLTGATGQLVRIAGANFSGVSAVTFNGVSASFVVQNDSIQATVPAGAATGKISVANCDGQVSTIVDFVVANPPPCADPISPADNDTTAQISGLLQWEPVTGPLSGYKVYLGISPSVLTLVSVQTQTSFAYNLSPLTRYYWKVVPYNGTGDALACQSLTFRTRDTPPSCANLLSPGNAAGSVPLNVNLDWSPTSTNATGYRVYVGPDTLSWNVYSTTQTQFTPPGLEGSSTYFWRVVPFNGNGTPNGCTIRSFTTIPCPDFNLVPSGTVTICENTAVLLKANGGISRLWSTGDTSKTIQIQEAGDYTATVDFGQGCIKTSTPTKVLVSPLPFINSNGLTSICQGESITLRVQNAAELLWSTGSTSSQISVSPSQTTTYYVSGISFDDCLFTDSITISVNPPQLPTTVTNMQPVNGSTSQLLPLNLSWQPGNFNTRFNIYLWPQGSTQPSLPYYADYTGITLTLSSFVLDYGKTYFWRVESENGNCGSVAGPIQSFSIVNYPDLVVPRVSASPTAFSGDVIGIDWTIKNLLGPTGNGQWYDRIWLSSDTILNDGTNEIDVKLAEIPRISALDSGQSYANLQSLYLPEGISGTWHVFVKTNLEKFGNGNSPGFPDIYEANYTNNVRRSAPINVTLSAPPDLRVTNIQTTPFGNVFSGTDVSVTFTIKNFGENVRRPNASWTDRIYFSSLPSLNLSEAVFLGEVVRTGPLKSDSVYTATKLVRIPKHIFGTYYIYVVADQGNTLFESPFDNNNTRQLSIEVTLTPPPDLTVSNITLPSLASNRQNVPVSFSVLNLGPNETDANTADRLYLSKRSDGDLFDAIPLQTRQAGLYPLAGGQSYTTNTTIEIPDDIEGPYYLYVKADVYDDLFEYTAKTNNLVRSTNPILIQSPDLEITALTNDVEVTSGQSFNLDFTVRNNGPGIFYPYTAGTNFYLQTGATFDSIAGPLNQRTITDTLRSGETASYQFELSVPTGPSGQRYLSAWADAYNQVFEAAKENNNLRTSTQVVTVRNPDLLTENLTLPDTGFSGRLLNLSFFVRNAGDGPMNNRFRNDHVYISTQPTFNAAQAIYLLTNSGYETFGVGGSRQYELQVPLPDGISGNYFVYVFADAGDYIYENGSETNNLLRSANLLPIKLSPYPDLQVTNITTVDSLLFGSKVKLAFTIQNFGNGPAAGASWKDRVFLATSANLTTASASVTLAEFTRTQTLEKGGSYLVEDSIELPQPDQYSFPLTGPVYLHVVTDADNSQYEYSFEGNNKSVRQKTIKTLPLPDLKMMSVVTPTTAQSGLQTSINYTVKNVGGPTSYWGSSYWTDAVILSADTFYNQGDIKVAEFARNSGLSQGESYNRIDNFTVPDGLSGRFYLLMATDIYGSVDRDTARRNNYRLIRNVLVDTVQFITIVATPAPDLVIVELSGPTEVNAGQPVKLSRKVKNTGPGPTKIPAWEDALYLSQDLNLGTSDELLALRVYTGLLLPGQEYSDTTEVTIPADAEGNYVFIAQADKNNKVYERNGETNNTRLLPVNVVQPSPSDLIIASVTPPASVSNGATATLSYRFKNMGPSPVLARLSNAVYFSTDTILDVLDLLARIDTLNVNLASGQHIDVTKALLVNGLPVGFYYVLVRADLYNNFPELKENNNLRPAATPTSVSMPQLPIGITVGNTLVSNEFLYYRIAIPANLRNETLEINLKGDSNTANNELYLRYGQIPTRAQFDFKYGKANSGNQSFLVEALDSGSYYLASVGKKPDNTNQPITLRADILPFVIRSVATAKGGNTGTVTVDIRGSKFTAATVFQLVKGAEIIPAIFTNFISRSKVFARFDLSGHSLGKYDVVATKGAETTTLIQGFEIEPTNTGGFYLGLPPGTVNNGLIQYTGPGCNPNASAPVSSPVVFTVNHPASARVEQIIPMTIQFGNSGNVDVPIPTRFIESLQGAPLSFLSDSLVNPAEFITNLPVDLQETDGPPNVLRPGAIGSITVYTKGTEQNIRVLYFKLN